MDIKQIRYFLEVAEARSFSRASARIRITQPALSRQVIQLEEELGVRLLVRHGRGVQLTESGMRFREKAEAIARHMEQLLEEVRDRSDVLTGEVILGIPPTLGPLLTVPLVQKFTQAYPNVFLRVAVGISEVIRDNVASGKYDIGVVLASEQIGPLMSEPLLTEPVYLVGKASEWPDDPGSVDAAVISQVPLLLTGAPNGIRTMVEDYARAQRRRLQIKVEMNSMSLMMSSICNGTGFAVLPRCALAGLPKDHGVRAEPVENLNISWVITSSKERYQSTAAIKLKQMLLEQAALNTHKNIAM